MLKNIKTTIIFFYTYTQLKRPLNQQSKNVILPPSFDQGLHSVYRFKKVYSIIHSDFQSFHYISVHKPCSTQNVFSSQHTAKFAL